MNLSEGKTGTAFKFAPIDEITIPVGEECTDIYIDFDQRKVDAANRRVIDYVLQITSK